MLKGRVYSPLVSATWLAMPTSLSQLALAHTVFDACLLISRRYPTPNPNPNTQVGLGVFDACLLITSLALVVRIFRLRPRTVQWT